MTAESFHAFLVQPPIDGKNVASIQSLNVDQLPAGDVLIQVNWSSLNYKDALAAKGHPGVARSLPHVPGIDAAGVVVRSDSPDVQVGQSVIVTGYELGSGRWGGWSRYIRVPAEWVVPLPDGLSEEAAMGLGTAGFTAALCVQQLQRNEVTPASGRIAVTGASGGVGCLAVQLLSKLGYDVVASTGKADAADWLKSLGAKEVVSRDEFASADDRALASARWAGAVDTVGGRTLATLLRETQPFGCVTVCGMVGGVDLQTTIHPFILRGIVLSGVSASLCRAPRRHQIWHQLAGPWKISGGSSWARVVTLQDVDGEVEKMVAGRSRGRVVISLTREGETEVDKLSAPRP